MTSVQTAVNPPTYGRGDPPPPLVASPREDRGRWAENTVLLFVTGAVVTYFCVLAVVAVYYDLFETIPAVTRAWHRLIPDPALRHAVRDVGEGLLGGLGGVYAVRNRYKVLKPKNWLDRLEIDHLHVPNVKDDKRSSLWWLLGLPVLVIVYAQVGFWAAFGIITAVRHVWHVVPPTAAAHLPASTASLQGRLTATFLSQWPNKLMGYAAAFFLGRRPAKAVFDDLQLWLCEQRVLRDQYLPRTTTWLHRLHLATVVQGLGKRSVQSSAPWYYPPTWKATFNDVKATGATKTELHGKAPLVAIRTLSIVAIRPGGPGLVHHDLHSEELNRRPQDAPTTSFYDSGRATSRCGTWRRRRTAARTSRRTALPGQVGW